MAITPTTMIAAQGMLSGGGVGVNSDMTSAISAATSNPVVGGVTSLQAQQRHLQLATPQLLRRSLHRWQHCQARSVVLLVQQVQQPHKQRPWHPM